VVYAHEGIAYHVVHGGGAAKKVYADKLGLKLGSVFAVVEKGPEAVFVIKAAVGFLLNNLGPDRRGLFRGIVFWVRTFPRVDFKGIGLKRSPLLPFFEGKYTAMGPGKTSVFSVDNPLSA
jgi:hypothetical protein